MLQALPGKLGKSDHPRAGAGGQHPRQRVPDEQVRAAVRRVWSVRDCRQTPTQSISAAYVGDIRSGSACVPLHATTIRPSTVCFGVACTAKRHHKETHSGCLSAQILNPLSTDDPVCSCAVSGSCLRHNEHHKIITGCSPHPLTSFMQATPTHSVLILVCACKRSSRCLVFVNKLRNRTSGNCIAGHKH